MIKINIEGLNCTVIRKNKKNVSIKIDETGSIVLSVPNRLHDNEIENIIISHKEWINNKINEINKKKNSIKKRSFKSGETLPFLGAEHKINLIPCDNIYAKVELKNDMFNIYINRNIKEEYREDIIKTYLEKWYKQTSLTVFIERIKFYSDKYNFYPKKISIRDQKSLWGSCSYYGNISLCYRLIMAPVDIIDYIVVHELCHLIHKNHAEEFWNAVVSIISDYKDKKYWLKLNGYKLKLF